MKLLILIYLTLPLATVESFHLSYLSWWLATEPSLDGRSPVIGNHAQRVGLSSLPELSAEKDNFPAENLEGNCDVTAMAESRALSLSALSLSVPSPLPLLLFSS